MSSAKTWFGCGRFHGMATNRRTNTAKTAKSIHHDMSVSSLRLVRECYRRITEELRQCRTRRNTIENGDIWREKVRSLIASLLLIFSLNMSAQQPETRSLSSPEPGLQVRQEFRRAYNAKDVDAVVALYADDATLVSDGGTFKGRDGIRKWVKAGVDQGSRLEAIEPSVEKSSGTLAYETGRTRRLVGSVVHLGQYLIVMEKIGGRWKIVQHFSLSAGETDRE